MRRHFSKSFAALGLAAFALGALSATAGAQSLMERAKSGEPLRLGFANEVPWAYPGENKEPKGFVNAIAIGILENMGYENIQPVVTEWGGLIPGLAAGRSDIITGGMYILKERCESVAFSDPIGVFGDAFIVTAANPKGIQNYQDIIEKDAVFVTGAGYNQVKVAKQQGIPDGNIMEVPGPTEILAAVRAGRADAGGVTYFTARNLAEQSGGAVDVTDPKALPEETLNWVGIAFRDEDQEFLEAFNEELAEYIGSDEMMAAVEEYGYTEAQLPDDATTEYACANR